MQIDPLLSLLVGALGAALLGLLGAWLQSGREHRAWTAALKWEVYREFLAFMDREAMRITSKRGPATKAEVDEWAVALTEALSPVTILAPKYVRVRAALLMHEVMKLKPGTAPSQDPRDKYLAAIQDDLRVSTWPHRVQRWFLRRRKRKRNSPTS
jgi:hypothetical protein